MNPKQRILTAMRGEEVDRIPWCPFLAYWWDYQPQPFQDKGQLAFLQDIGADPLLRGSHALWEKTNPHCAFREITNGDRRNVTYETPMGNLQAVQTFIKDANTWFLTEHPIKTQEDFKILTYIHEHIQLKSAPAKFNADHAQLGDQGLYLPMVGTDAKTSFQSLVEYWVGTQELIYALHDYPEVVEACLQVMTVKSIETARISAESSAEAFIFWEDSSTTNISPGLFKKYAAPEINAWGTLLHRAGKLLIHHACGHIKGLLPEMSTTGIDMIESISPPPTGNIELWDAQKALPDTIGLIGGIEPTVFLNSSLPELEEYVTRLLDKMGKRNFILANSDSCPPGVTIEKFRLVTEINNRYRP